MLVIAGARMAAPRVDFEQIRMQIDGRPGNDVKCSPGEHEKNEQNCDRPSVALEIEPGIDRALDRRDQVVTGCGETHAMVLKERPDAIHAPAARAASRRALASTGCTSFVSSVSAT